jgi:hypothetical protein
MEKENGIAYSEKILLHEPILQDDFGARNQG